MPRSSLAILGLALTIGCGAEVESDPEPCDIDERLIDKRWFVGELDMDGDEPAFVATISVVDVTTEGLTPQAFVGKSAQREVRFAVEEDFMAARSEEDSVVAGYAIASHHESACVAPCAGEELESCSLGPLPWQERPWMLVDFGQNLGEPPRFDAATAAGHPDAVSYDPIAFHTEENPKLDIEQGTLAVENRVWVSFEDCSYDFPELPPGAECPPAQLTLRYEFRR